MCPAGPLRSTVVTRFFATTSPADFRRRRLPSRGRRVPPTASDLPGSLADLSARAAPNHPGKSGCCTSRCLHSRWQAAHSLGGRPLPTFVTRPNRVQCLRPAPSTLAFRRATTSRWPSAAPAAGSPPSTARRSTCRASDSHGQHLTVDEISQAWPGAPESAESAEMMNEVICARRSSSDEKFGALKEPPLQHAEPELPSAARPRAENLSTLRRTNNTACRRRPRAGRGRPRRALWASSNPMMEERRRSVRSTNPVHSAGFEEQA